MTLTFPEETTAPASGQATTPRPRHSELFENLYISMVRRASVMHRCGQSHLVGLALWLAIETYVRTPGRDRLTREEGDELYELLEPHFDRPSFVPAPSRKPRQPQQAIEDAALMQAEKERRTDDYLRRGRDWFGRPLGEAS